MARTAGRAWVKVGSLLAAAALTGSCASGSADDDAVGVAEVAAVSNGEGATTGDTGSTPADTPSDTAATGGSDPTTTGADDTSGGAVATGPLDPSAAIELEGAVEVVLGRETHAFAGRGGQLVSVNLTSMNGGCESDQEWDLRIDVRRADGTDIDDDEGNDVNAGIYGCDGFGPWTLPEDGDYVVTFAGANNGKGTYTAVLGFLALETTPVDLSSPAPVEGGIEVALDSDRYQFEAAAGDQVSVEITGLNGSCENDQEWGFRIDVRKADGSDIDGEDNDANAGIYGCDGYGPWTLPEDGTYLFTFTGDGAEVGTFSAILGRL